MHEKHLATLTPWIKVKAVWKYIPEDFKVKEITERYGMLEFTKHYTFKGGQGKHLVCIFIKKNVETFQMIKSISKLIHISPQRISLSGIKDKKAYTIQLGSIYNVKKEKVEKISTLLPNIKIIPITYSEKKVYLGEHIGNAFEIVLRKIKKEDLQKIKLQEYKEKYNLYFPNYYGVQRFGSNQKSTAELGYLLLKREYEKFLIRYLNLHCKTLQECSPSYIASTKMGYHERSVAKYLLAHNSTDIIGAIKVIPPSLLKMFVHAYQSYLFNIALSHILKTSSWEDIKNHYLLIPGSDFESIALKDEYSEIIIKYLEKDKIKAEDFVFTEFGFECKGTKRKLLEHAQHLHYIIEKDDIFQGYYKIKLSFSLHKGAYASSFLNEMFDMSENP